MIFCSCILYILQFYMLAVPNGSKRWLQTSHSMIMFINLYIYDTLYLCITKKNALLFLLAAYFTLKLWFVTTYLAEKCHNSFTLSHISNLPCLSYGWVICSSPFLILADKMGLYLHTNLSYCATLNVLLAAHRGSQSDYDDYYDRVFFLKCLQKTLCYK